MSRLITSQNFRNGHTILFCDGWLSYFTSIYHHIFTIIPTTTKEVNKFGYSISENILQFENFEGQMEVPFVIFADFECDLKNIAYEEQTDPKKFYCIFTLLFFLLNVVTMILFPS